MRGGGGVVIQTLRELELNSNESTLFTTYPEQHPKSPSSSPVGGFPNHLLIFPSCHTCHVSLGHLWGLFLEKYPCTLATYGQVALSFPGPSGRPHTVACVIHSFSTTPPFLPLQKFPFKYAYLPWLQDPTQGSKAKDTNSKGAKNNSAIPSQDLPPPSTEFPASALLGDVDPTCGFAVRLPSIHPS